ncbi:FtsX-like permease family protein [Haloimpatiens sp. FM7330]|uniref:FtsX-like permease family protein n=1 Tax=Haloimpatiens sp. FM7330 TaxID=3298610 RepID=UPI003637932D
MYKKLILQNSKKSMKDYLIYILTCTLSVGMLYAFLSITSSYYKTNLPPEFNLDSLHRNLRLPLIAVAFLLIFLIRYVNQYMLNKKKKEFALQSTLGMESRSISGLFFLETSLMGAIAIFFGIILGAFLSQIVSMIVMNSFNGTFKIQNSIYPDTILITVVSFMILFFLVGLGNVREINKLKIIEMLNDTKIMESNKKHKSSLLIYVFLISEVAFLLLSVLTFIKLYDTRFSVGVKITYYGSMFLPIITIVFYLIYHMLKKKKKHILDFEIIGTIFGFISCVFGVLLFGVVQGLDEKLLPNDRTMYLLIPTILFILTIFIFYQAVSKYINFMKVKSEHFYLKNVFLLGQLNAKVNRNSISMAIITLTLFGGILTLCLSTLISGWAMGYLETRAVYDVSVDSCYKDIYKKEQLPKKNHSFDYLDRIVLQKGYSINQKINVPLFFIHENHFWKRNKYEFPILAIKESDFNLMAKSQDLPSIKLKKNEFAVQWYKLARNSDIESFNDKNKSIMVGKKKLTKLKKGDFHYRLGDMIYNKYTNCVIIIPDEITKNLMVADICYFMNINSKLTYKDAISIEKEVKKAFLKDDSFPKENVDIRLKTLQANSSIQASIMIKLIMTYVGVILLIICFTVLSLQQLSDSSEHKYRFNLLYKLGMDTSSIRRIILKQMGIWFGLPVIISILCSRIVLWRFVHSAYSELNAYVGMSRVNYELLVTYGIIAILIIIYFLFTWILFNRNIELEDS